MALCTCDCDCIDVDEKITTDTLEDLITEALGMAQDGVFLRPGSELLQCKPFCCCLDCCGKCPSCCGCCLPCAPCLCASSYRLISRVTEKRSALVLANEKIEAVEFHMDTLAKMEAKVRPEPRNAPCVCMCGCVCVTSLQGVRAKAAARVLSFLHSLSPLYFSIGFLRPVNR